MREGPSSTPEFRQDLGEGLLEHDEGQLQGEGAGRAGVPLGVSGTFAMAKAPASCSTALSPLSSLILPGLLGGGGADKKTVPNSKPSTRSRAGLMFNLRGAEGYKVVCHSLADGHKTAKELESGDTASDTTSEAPSLHPAYDPNLSMESADGNLSSIFKKA